MKAREFVATSWFGWVGAILGVLLAFALGGYVSAVGHENHPTRAQAPHGCTVHDDGSAACAPGVFQP